MQDPSYLQQALQDIQASNPQLYEYIQQNPQAALQLLMGGNVPGVAPQGEEEPEEGEAIQVTEEEKAAINRVYNNIN